MPRGSPYDKGFVSVSAFEVTYRTENEAQILLLESRVDTDENRLIFTIINGTEVRASSIFDLVLKREDCISVSIVHNFSIWWNDASKKVEALEVIGRSNNVSYPIYVKLTLRVDNMLYESTEADSLEEAIRDLEEISGLAAPFWFQTCIHCDFSYPAFSGLTSERDELRCYRDAPIESFAEVKAKKKYASPEALSSGNYFVKAFHRCATWQPCKP